MTRLICFLLLSVAAVAVGCGGESKAVEALATTIPTPQASEQYRQEINARHARMVEALGLAGVAGAAAIGGDAASEPKFEQAARSAQDAARAIGTVEPPPCMKTADETVKRAVQQWVGGIGALVGRMRFILDTDPVVARVAMDQIQAQVRQGDAIWAVAVAEMQAANC
ncbi:MAG: hypothetical protein AB7R89_06250 [Dehalococcoidia bacterium]